MVDHVNKQSQAPGNVLFPTKMPRSIVSPMNVVNVLAQYNKYFSFD